MEDNKGDSIIPFLDAIVKPEADGGLSIAVYRKPYILHQQTRPDG